jgi:threonine synthase
VIVYRSTGQHGERVVTFRQALFEGQPPDGGLYMPEQVPAVDLARLRDGDFGASARAAMHAWLDAELDAAPVEALCREAFDFPAPLSRLDERTQLLELFHGPTAAFKDFGARFMARAMQRLRDPQRPLTVLVATSGDTGSAVAQAFAPVPDARVVLLYPGGKVSPLQELQRECSELARRRDVRRLPSHGEGRVS